MGLCECGEHGGVGEGMDDLMTFSAEDFAESLLAKPAEKED